MLSQHNDIHIILLMNIFKHWDGLEGREIFLAVCPCASNFKMEE